MIARLLRLSNGVLAVLAAAWFAALAMAGHWLGAGLGALFLLALQPAVLAIEFFVLLPCVNRADPVPRPRALQLLRAWWRESLIAHDAFVWQQAFRTERHPDTLDGAVRGERALILVHGFFCNRGVWNRCVPLLRRHGIAHVALTLEPPFAGIEHHTTALDAAIERARQATGVNPILVCHSMGGLVARAWWRAHAADAAARVHRVITIGTPHQGTFTARFARAANARQMRQGGDWLSRLATDECSGGRNTRFTCFYSHCDNIVLPASSATLPGADNRHLAGWPHVAMINAPQVWDEVLLQVRAAAD